MKALLIEHSLKPRKTHSINELILILKEKEVDIHLSEEECDLLDSIYLPSKYPLGSALPEFEPDTGLSRQCVSMAEKVYKRALEILE